MTPDATALILSRIQFGFTVSFHIIFPASVLSLAWVIVRRLGGGPRKDSR